MPIFEEVRLGWKGKEYKIPRGQVMQVIGDIESIITLGELTWQTETNRIQLKRVAEAFACALRHAGAAVDVEEVYEGMFGVNDGQRTIVAVSALLALMMPPSVHAKAAEVTAIAKKRPGIAPSSSRKPTRSR